MRQLCQLPLVGLLLFVLLPSQLCNICEVQEEDYSQLDPLISTMVKSKYTRGIQAANVLLSLKLAGISDQSSEGQMTRQVEDDVTNNMSNLTSGQLALSIMALGACQNPNTYFKQDRYLIRQLETKFKAEIENMERNDGNPLTNYYQLGLDVLALCLFKGNYSTTKVAELFTPENKNFRLGHKFSVDTGAMAVLALTCVKRSTYRENIKCHKKDLKRIKYNIASLVKKILHEKKENGLIGNIYSTGEAMQALFVSSRHYKEREWECQRTLDKVLEEISHGAFRMPIAAAQVLPALMGKTLLDINKYSCCINNTGYFNISPVTATPTVSPSYIKVHYSVKIRETYSTEITVRKGSVFLDVMEEAQKINKTEFGFTSVESSWGPYITSVQGVTANNNNRTYWQLLNNGKPLDQGVGSYIVHEGDNLEVRWSTY
ncbi:transcobalamin-1 [Manis pentadactyla]|uniref:transcobalamin-1 n=1 Tax=Manis pentadactyla TaxID=143292 RepID=UPI00255C7160|nr:transcobalamin-1 [Manis pentadactyla]